MAEAENEDGRQQRKPLLLRDWHVPADETKNANIPEPWKAKVRKSRPKKCQSVEVFLFLIHRRVNQMYLSSNSASSVSLPLHLGNLIPSLYWIRLGVPIIFSALMPEARSSLLWLVSFLGLSQRGLSQCFIKVEFTSYWFQLATRSTNSRSVDPTRLADWVKQNREAAVLLAELVPFLFLQWCFLLIRLFEDCMVLKIASLTSF